MLCRICGTPVKEGERFCSLCGEKVERTEEIQQSGIQQAYGGQPDNQQAYGGQPDNQQAYGGQSYRRQTYGQEESRQSYRRQAGRRQFNDQQYGQQSYDQQYGTQSFNNMYYNTAGRSRKGLWITLGLVAVLAIAAVLIFTVFGDILTANPQGTPIQRTLPFKGDTVQTKLANDTAKVIYDAFDIFGNVGIDLNGMAEQPFDMRLDMTMKSKGEKANVIMEAAYDNETFGMNMNVESASVKMLLIEDILYMDALGSAVGIDLNSTADLSKPMTLQERLTSFTEGFNLPQSTSIEVFAILLMNSPFCGDKDSSLTELLLSSIDESCYESIGSKTTLTLHDDDLSAILRTFALKLEADENLKKMYAGLIKAGSVNPDDVIRQLNDEADALDEQKGSDFKIIWEVSYKNEKPVSFEITVNDGGEKGVHAFYGYEKNGDSTDFTIEYTPDNSSPGISVACSFKKAGSRTEFEGTIISQGMIMAFFGNIAFSGNNTHGTITMNVPGAGETVTIDFNLTLNIGMPYFDIKDDGRFKIDTDSADIVDVSSMFGMYGLPIY